MRKNSCLFLKVGAIMLDIQYAQMWLEINTLLIRRGITNKTNDTVFIHKEGDCLKIEKEKNCRIYMGISK